MGAMGLQGKLLSSMGHTVAAEGSVGRTGHHCVKWDDPWCTGAQGSNCFPGDQRILLRSLATSGAPLDVWGRTVRHYVPWAPMVIFWVSWERDVDKKWTPQVIVTTQDIPVNALGSKETPLYSAGS
jgi:hypothetical protein